MKGIQKKLRKLAFMGVAQPNSAGAQPQAEPGSEEQVFTEQIRGTLQNYMTSKFPWLHPESVLTVLETDLDKNSITASLDLKLDDKNIRIPVLFQNGNIVEPWAIFIESEKRMYPLSEKWYKKIINSASDDLGSTNSMNDAAYWNAVNQSNEVLNSNVVRGVRGYHYAALNNMSLIDIMPLVKTSMQNGYIYDAVGRTAIKVAAQKYLKIASLKPVKSKLKLGDGAFIITKDTLSKVAGLSFTENTELYNTLLEKDWCLHYRGNLKKKAGQVDIMKVVDEGDDKAQAVNSSFFLNAPARLWGSFNKYTGKPMFLIPTADNPTLSSHKTYKNENYQLEEKGGLWNKTTVLNSDTDDTLKEVINLYRIKDFPKEFEKFKAGEYLPKDKDGKERSLPPFYVIPQDFSRETFFRVVHISCPESYNDVINELDIESTEDGIMKSYDGTTYAFLNKEDFDAFFTHDAEAFVRKTPTIEEYVRNSFSVKKNLDDSYDISVKDNTTEEESSAYQINKKVASFLLANYLNVPEADSFLDEHIELSGKHYKFAAQIAPEAQSQLAQAIQQLTSIASNLEAPEAQKEVLDASGKGGITINIDTLTLGNAANTAMPEEAAAMGGEAGLPEGTDLNSLISELINLGVPESLVDQILQAGEMAGASPEETIIEAGAFIEENNANGIPVEQSIAVLQEQVSALISGVTPGMEPVVAAAATPYATDPSMAGQAPMPAQMDATMQQAGQAMLQEMPPAAPAQMPVAEAMANPAMQQMAEIPEMGINETMNKGVLADIVANAAIKTKFIDYLPMLNDTVNAISEIILKIELNRKQLTNEVGATNVDETVEILRNVLNQLGSLILEVAQFD